MSRPARDEPLRASPARRTGFRQAAGRETPLPRSSELPGGRFAGRGAWASSYNLPMVTGSAAPSFHGLRVLALESRRAIELATLITTYGGQPIVAPALREVPLESNTEALGFADALIRGELEVVIFLTGVGTRALVNVIEPAYSRDAIAAALARTRVVARGPKPLAV